MAKKKEDKKMEDQIDTLINQLEAQTGGNTIIIIIIHLLQCFHH